MPNTLDTKIPSTVCSAVEDCFLQAFGKTEDTDIVPRLFATTEAMFQGKYLDYAPNDVRYHDLEHTMQATLCLARLLTARHLAQALPILTERQYVLALTAALLHDTGYLRKRSDSAGTGAKYSHLHVERGCKFAQAFLPTVGFVSTEIESIIEAINSTEITCSLSDITYTSEIDKTIGAALATADFLAQMAAADYPDELEILFREFEEADDFCDTPKERRIFKSAEDLIRRTPAFWEKFVLPRLHNEYMSLHNYLAVPYPGGPNPYLQAIEANIEIIRARATAV